MVVTRRGVSRERVLCCDVLCCVVLFLFRSWNDQVLVPDIAHAAGLSISAAAEASIFLFLAPDVAAPRPFFFVASLSIRQRLYHSLHGP
jgi:hypothetical protein